MNILTRIAQLFSKPKPPIVAPVAPVAPSVDALLEPAAHIKRGTVRESDGMVMMCKKRNKAGNIVYMWVTPERYQKHKDAHRKYMRNYMRRKAKEAK